jgi:hypothetical protein
VLVLAASAPPVTVNMRRAVPTMFAIDRAENSRLNRDVTDREIYAAGTLIALTAWVVHGYRRNRGRRWCGPLPEAKTVGSCSHRELSSCVGPSRRRQLTV